jgi:CRP-like cAMP-binding protein
MISIYQYLKETFILDDQQIADFLAMGKPFSTEKGHYLLKPTQTSNRVFFIEEGIVREFERLPKKEHTRWILDEGNWLYNMLSYYTQNPADCYLEAITDAKGYYFRLEDIDRLVEESHVWSKVQVGIYRKHFMQMIYRDRLRSLETVEEKLEFFEEQQRSIQNYIKQEHIASFLHVSKSQLSRVRSKRTQNRRVKCLNFQTAKCKNILLHLAIFLCPQLQ